MACHMKTTLRIDDAVMARLKREAIRRRCTMSELVENSLRTTLQSRPHQNDLAPLPTFRGGGARLDIADRNALYDVFDRDD